MCEHMADPVNHSEAPGAFHIVEDIEQETRKQVVERSICKSVDVEKIYLLRFVNQSFSPWQ